VLGLSAPNAPPPPPYRRLSRKPGGAIFVTGKKSFLEHFGDVFDEKAP